MKSENLKEDLSFPGKHIDPNTGIWPIEEWAAEREPEEILAEASTAFLTLAERTVKTTLMPPGAIVEAAGGPSIYLNRKNRTTGISSGFPGLDFNYRRI